jgi:hypothetical protein
MITRPKYDDDIHDTADSLTIFLSLTAHSIGTDSLL